MLIDAIILASLRALHFLAWRRGGVISHEP